MSSNEAEIDPEIEAEIDATQLPESADLNASTQSDSLFDDCDQMEE